MKITNVMIVALMLGAAGLVQSTRAEQVSLVDGLPATLPTQNLSLAKIVISCKRFFAHRGGTMISKPIGDLDGNKRINEVDVKIIAKLFMNKKFDVRADINGDQRVDAIDVLIASQLASGDLKSAGRSVFKMPLSCGASVRFTSGDIHLDQEK